MLEAEIKQLQQVLHQRDDEINALEMVLRSTTTGTSPYASNPGTIHPEDKGNQHPAAQPACPVGLARALSATSTVLSDDTTPKTPDDREHAFASACQDATAAASGQTSRTKPNVDVDHDYEGRLDTLMQTMAQKEIEHAAQCYQLSESLALAMRKQEELQKRSLSKDCGVSHVANEPNNRPPTPPPPRSIPPTPELVSTGFQTTPPAPTACSYAQTDVSDWSSRQPDGRDQLATGEALNQLIEDSGVTLPSEESVDDPIVRVQGLIHALKKAQAKQCASEQQLQDLESQTRELAHVREALNTASQNKVQLEQTIKELNAKVQDLSVIVKRQSQTSSDGSRDHSVTSMASGSRTSFNRVATPTSRIPPLLPPPSVPPPPLPSPQPTMPPVAEGSDSSVAIPPTSKSQQGATSESRPNSMGQDAARDLASRVVSQEQAMAELTTRLVASETALKTSTDTVSNLTQNVQSLERNIRKLRLQSQESTRERDGAQLEIQRLQKELEAAQNEVAIMQSSVVSEKQSLEDRLSEERIAKEQARAQLRERLEAAPKHKSKFTVSLVVKYRSVCVLWLNLAWLLVG